MTYRVGLDGQQGEGKAAGPKHFHSCAEQLNNQQSSPLLQLMLTLTLSCRRQNPQNKVGVITIIWDLPSSFLMSRVGANGGLIITLSPARLPACFR
jgi:hypothetical protein